MNGVLGDAQSSTVREPVAHSFNASGIYTISLKVYNDFCSDITTEEITILPTLPEIVYGNSGDGCPPLNVEFSNLTTEATSFLWDFGDGNTSSLVTPSHTYSNSGVYTVTLTATGPGGTSVANNVQVTVHNVPVAAATASPSSGCSPLQVYFDNISTGAVSYLWDFGDGSISSDVMSPTHVFYTGNYSAQLLVENTFGCTSSINIPVRVFPQWDVEILATPNQGCHPLQSLVVASAGGVMYNWDLGDGTIFTAGNSFSHRFNNNSLEIAEYNISVEAVNQNSCIARAQASIVVFPAPQAVFEAQPHSQQLPNRQVAFVNHTAGDLWDFEWDFGDGAASNDKNPLPHSYADAGEYTITLTASANDCSNSTSAWVQILPVIPQIEFSNPQEGCPPLSVTFANNTFGANSFLWEFGDGMLSQDRSPTHVYHAPGVYNVRLTATGVGGISFSEDVFITVHTAPVALFEVVPKIISIPGPSPVFINRSIDAVSYLWDFGDGNGSTDFSPKHNYASAGVYTISLNATSADGCEHRYSIPEAIIVQLGGELKFPNAFTPSASGPSGGRYQYGDPQNHIFYPFTQEGIVEYQLQIFTRWGEIIFESSDIEIGWDGYHRGKLAPQGVYIWRARYKTAAGNEETRAGDVTLIR
jgi:gliding motility-associated-like protein